MHTFQFCLAVRPYVMTAAKRQQALASRRKPEVGSWATAIALQCLIRPSPGIGATCRASKQRFEKLRAADRGFETMSLLRSSVGRKHGLLWPTARTLGLTPPGYGLSPLRGWDDAGLRLRG